MAYRCDACGYSTGRWMGFCPQCGSSGLVEGHAPPAPGRTVEAAPLSDLSSQLQAAVLVTGIGELDRVLGGGLVEGSAIVLGGEPGVGKSTLLLQAATEVAKRVDVLYVSAEESRAQVARRAARVGAPPDRLLVAVSSDVDAVVAAVEATRPALAIIDSIQTVRASDESAIPGGVAQVRECGHRLIAMARRTGCSVVMVGHVTKDGNLAGPKVLEHAVDAVVMLEGDHDAGLRVLRSVKNRHGSTDRIGVFEMTDGGLNDVLDPSARLVGDHTGSVPGTVLFPAVHGRRSLLVEVQALVVPSSAPHPRRAVNGIDASRVHQLLAVLERHADMRFRDQEVHVSVAGGVRVVEPAADLPVALALASSRTSVPLGRLAAFGEVSLTGEVRAVGRATQRVEEASRLGVEHVVQASSRRRDTVVTFLAQKGLVQVGEASSRPLRRPLRITS